jgi:hypothetical protein
MSRFVLASFVLSLAVAASGAGGALAMSACSSGKIAKAGPYVFALSIGPYEAMYTLAQVSTKHPTDGEVMVSGKMVGGMAGMDMGPGSQRHLEVHICSTGGKVVTGVHPSITVNGSMVPIAVMYGVDAGRADTHYGNNVDLKTGQKVRVVVKLNGKTAIFDTTVPKSSSM